MKFALYRLVLVFCAVIFSAQLVYAKEPFNIRGIRIGDTLEDVKEVFPDIELESVENKVHCKEEDFVFENGTSFKATLNVESQNYSFNLIYVDGVETVVKEEFSYVATSVSEEMFLERVIEKFDIDEINEENIKQVKDAMPDYRGITRFVVPEGHYFKIEDDDIFRLKYFSSAHDSNAPNELTHTIEIESNKYKSLEENQEKLGEEEKRNKEKECGLQELKDLGF